MNTYVPVFNFSQLTKFCISLLSDFQTKMQIVLNKNVFLLKIMNEKNERSFLRDFFISFTGVYKNREFSLYALKK